MSYKRKQYYGNQGQRKSKQFCVQPGLKGFLCSCNNNEKDCIREAYNLLNTYADKVAEPPKSPKTDGNEIEDDLSAELESLKEQNKQPVTRRFQVVDSGAKNFLFLRTTLENPLALVQNIVDDITVTKQQQTRFLIRLVPIEVTCKAYVPDIELALKPLIQKYFSGESKTFAIAFNHRNNNSVKKDEVIKVVADLVAELKEDVKVNLDNPDVSIVIEVVKAFAFLAVIPNYIKYKKFNLHMLCEKEENKQEATVVNDEVNVEGSNEAHGDEKKCEDHVCQKEVDAGSSICETVTNNDVNG